MLLTSVRCLSAHLKPGESSSAPLTSGAVCFLGFHVFPAVMFYQSRAEVCYRVINIPVSKQKQSLPDLVQSWIRGGDAFKFAEVA